MRAIIQRVKSASVSIEGAVMGQIDAGLLILLGITHEDSLDDVSWLVKKIAALRIFDDEQGVMNRSLLDTRGQALVVSQFTLMASYKKGNRPSYIRAAAPEHAIPLYEAFVQELSRAIAQAVPTGQFGADMQVSLINDGPVTIAMDTHNKE